MFLVFKRAVALSGAILALLTLLHCTTTELTPEPPPMAKAPEYLYAPHPAGFDLFDLRSLFLDKAAPKIETLKTCEEKIKKLKDITLSNDEFRQGVRELVKESPVFYHWCFYGKLVTLDDQLKTDSYLEERQKHVLEAYAYAVPLARGFLIEFRDSRYMRWAVRHYRQLSEVVFFRKLDVSPQMTQELVEVANPFGFVRTPVPEKPVLEKYNLQSESVVEKPKQAEETKGPTPDRGLAIDEKSVESSPSAKEPERMSGPESPSPSEDPPAGPIPLNPPNEESSVSSPAQEMP